MREMDGIYLHLTTTLNTEITEEDFAVCDRSWSIAFGGQMELSGILPIWRSSECQLCNCPTTAKSFYLKILEMVSVILKQ